MWETISSALSTENGALAALVAFAWQLLAGKKRDAVEARVKEVALRAWRFYRVMHDGQTPAVMFAEREAMRILDELGIKRTSDIAKLVRHEIEQLAIADMFAELPDLGDPEKLFAEAEARGKAAGKARSDNFDTTVIAP